MNRRLSDASKRDPWSVVYAMQGSDGFNARLHGVLRDLTRDTLAAVGDPLVAVVVAGAYGDGLGRCVSVNAGPGNGIWSHGQAPGEDIELLVVANANRNIIRRLLIPVSRKYSAILNVEVRFIHILDEFKLNQVRPSLAWYELVQSHQLLFGSESIFARLRQCYGLVEDGCVRPRFAAGEALWLLCHTAFQALKFYGQAQKTSLRNFFSLIRHLGDVLLLQVDNWEMDSGERNTEILQVLSDDDWFRNHTQAALSLHELYRESISYFSAEPSDSISEDWPAFIQAWLLVDDYVSSFSQNAVSSGIVLNHWHRLMRNGMVSLQVHDSQKNPFFSWPLFRQLADWYYRDH